MAKVENLTFFRQYLYFRLNWNRLMLYRLEIENFCSIRERQTLDLTISPNVPDPDNRFAEIFPRSKLRAPKVIALYGANASGKTTVLRALDLITAFPRHNPRVGAGIAFSFDSFNNSESLNEPVKLAIELGGMMNLNPEDSSVDVEPREFGVFRYELELNRSENGGHTVSRELLLQRPASATKWRRVFERDEQHVKGPTKDMRFFSLAGYGKILDRLPPGTSVIATLAEFQHAPSTVLATASGRVFTNVRMNPGTNHDGELVNYLATTPALVSRLNEDLGRVDLGLDQMRIEQTPNGPMPMFKHDGHKQELPWPAESQGTRAFFRIFPFIEQALEQGGISIIDEIDGMMHPLLLPEIVGWFYDSQGRNANDAQLWLSCHSASLLEDLTKEEVVICEKDNQGRTEMFSLMDVGSVRRDDNLYKKYLSGVYGGVPHIG